MLSLTLAGSPATPEESRDRLAWWREARFGLFIHWDPVSLVGTEISWSRAGERRGYPFGNGTEVPVDVYDNLYKRFKPDKFDARAWVRMAKAAGMKYIVFTARHHDGFSMFDTHLSDYKVTAPDCPFGVDVVRKLADACHREGMRFGLYYSQPDWHNADAFTDRHAKYLAYMHGQVRELLTNYGKVDLLWFDGLGKGDDAYGATEMLKMIRSLQPDIIVNDRSGAGGDYRTPEQEIGEFDTVHPWETCMTIGDQWAYKPHDRVKSLAECLQTLVRCAGGDGNLLFNLGPRPDGSFEPEQMERIGAMGAWLRKYGESVYGTRGGPYHPTESLACTHRPGAIYLHVLRWDGDTLDLPAPELPVQRLKVLTGGAATYRVSEGRLRIKLPADRHDPIDTVIKLTTA